MSASTPEVCCPENLCLLYNRKGSYTPWQREENPLVGMAMRLSVRMSAQTVQGYDWMAALLGWGRMLLCNNMHLREAFYQAKHRVAPQCHMG